MRIERRKSIVAILFLVLLMSYKVGVTMFVHAHDVDGTMVVHSHPFTSSNHSHSSSQVIAIGQLSSFNGIENATYEEINIFRCCISEIEIINNLYNVINVGIASLLLRAPPVCC